MTAPIIDVHAHFVPEDYRQALLEAGLEHPDGSPIPPWTATSHLARMDALGISTSMLSISSPGPGFNGEATAWARRLNEEGAQLVQDYPGRFGLLACLPLPDVEASVREARHALDTLAADGIAVLTNYQGIYLGDERFAALMSELHDRRATVFIHPTSPAGCDHVHLGRPAPLVEYLFDTTRAVVNLALSGTLTRFPDINWIIPHNGALLTGAVDRIQLFAQHVLGKADADVSGTLSRLYLEVGSSAPFPRAAQAALDFVGVDRLVTGTDMPYAPPAGVEHNIKTLTSDDFLTGQDLAAVLSGNAARLFPRFS